MTDWSNDARQVIRALRFIKSKGAITPEQLVEWDDRHGRKLFDWEDAEAGPLWRAHQARLFFNKFRLTIGKFRVRGLINIPAGENRERAYYPVEEIAEQPDLRNLVVSDLTRRMTTLARELAMWKLSLGEQKDLFARLQEAFEAK